MSPTRRIFLNIVATYGRSLLALVCGLVTSRWVLSGIGVDGYGVYGVVGVIIGVCSTINGMIAGSVGRYYAYAYGEKSAMEDKQFALDECREWFNVALLLHLVFSVLLTAGGYVAGEWCLNNYFRIPEAYQATSHWVLHFTLLSLFVGMVSAPFRAMYVAQQRIFELTIYEIFVPLCSVCFAWLLLSYSGDRLLFHAGYSMLLAVAPNLIISIRALIVFPECKIDSSKMFIWDKLRRLCSFAGWQFVGMSGLMIRTQGTPTLVNRLLGVEFNSTMTVSNTMVNHVGALSTSLNNAFSPAVTNAAGAKDESSFQSLTLQTSKFGTLLLSMFAIPLLVEMDYIVHLWLKTVPPCLVQTCSILLLTAIVERSAMGTMIAINAIGNIRLHETLCFVLHIITLFACYVFASLCGLGIVGVGLGLLVGTAMIAVMRISLWKWQFKMPIRDWLSGFFLPFAILGSVSYFGGVSAAHLSAPSLQRVVISTLVVLLVFIGGSFLVLLNADERKFIVNVAVKRLRLKVGTCR